MDMKLLEPRQPVMELEIGDNIYPIYTHERLSVAVALKVAAANLEYERVLEEVTAGMESLAAQMNMAEDARRLSTLLASRTALEARLYTPKRGLIEAFADMTPGMLADIPPATIAEIFDEVCVKVFAAPADDRTQNKRKTAKQMERDLGLYIKSILDTLPLFARHGYKRREALALESWEFWAFVKSARKEENTYLVRQLSVNSIPNLDEIYRSRRIDELLEIEREESDVPWTAGFAAFLQQNG